jgi:hypothetical protein
MHKTWLRKVALQRKAEGLLGNLGRAEAGVVSEQLSVIATERSEA